MTSRAKLLLVGVGGQGVLTAARVLGDAAYAAGVGAVVGQLHGMSQRGGSVECSVLFGSGDSSFLVGDADVLLAFEPLEAARALPHVGPETVVIVNRGTIVPFQLTFRGEGYPSVDGIFETLRARGAVVYGVDGPGLVAQIGVGRTLNVVMLGALAGLGILPFGPDALLEQLTAHLPARFVSANRRAFELGMGSTNMHGRDGERREART